MVRPRDLLLLLAACATAAALFPEFHEKDDETARAIKRVHQTWNTALKVTINDDAFTTVGEGHQKRKKRSAVLPQITDPFEPPNAYCDVPGYTGEYCEFPICERTNNAVPEEPLPTGNGIHVDAKRLKTCDGKMTTVLDSYMDKIMISVQSFASVRPTLKLFNKMGVEIEPTKILPYSTHYEAEFTSQAPGLYVVQLSSSKTGSECHISVRAETTLSVVGGFVPYSSTVASERRDFPIDNAYAGDTSSFVVHANGLQSPGTIVSVTMYQENNVISRPQKLSTRFGCGYEFYLETFFCRDISATYYFRIEGIDFYGNKFRRIQTFRCLIAPPTIPGPTVSTTTSDPGPGPENCLHGGSLIVNADGRSYCYCNGLFTGRSCEAITCMNSGTPNNDEAKCICLQGYEGLHCEHVTCNPISEFGFGTSHRTMVIVLRVRSPMVTVINQIINHLEEIKLSLSNDPTYMRLFRLILFNDNSLTVVKEYTNLDGVRAALTNATKEATEKGGCFDTVFSALSEAFSITLANMSPVYVITDAVPSDEDQMETVLHQNSYHRIPVYFMYVQQAPSMGCSASVYQSGYRAMVTVAQRSSGHVFSIPNSQMDSFGDLFYNHLKHTYYRSNLIQSNDAPQCGALLKYQPIAIDIKTVELTVTAVGTNLQLVISNPDGAAAQAALSFRLNDTFIWSLKGPARGQWLITVKSSLPTSMCSYRIYTSQNFQQTEYDLFWAFTPTITQDDPQRQPVFGQDNALVAHINNYELADSSRVFAELTIRRTTQSGTQMIYLSNGIWRNQCAFQLYFPRVSCLYPSEMIYFTVFVRDNIGFMIQRSGVAYCSLIHPTYEPQGGCQNGGVPITMQDNSTACYCTPDYTGPHCEKLVCHNGGTLITEGGMTKCACAKGHTGDGCDIVTCIESAPSEPFSPIGRDMAFVFEMTRHSILSVKVLAEYLPGLIRDFTLHHPKWIQNYALIGYNSTWSGVIVKADREHTGNLIKAMNDVYKGMNKQPLPDGGCKVRVWHALEEALTLLSPDSYATVLHVSAPDKSEIRPAIEAGALARQKRIMVNVLFSYLPHTPEKYPCNATAADYDLLESFCDINGGRAYPVHQGDFYEAIRMIPNYYLSGLVYVRKLPDCGSQTPQRVYFPIDAYTQTIQINVRGYKNTMTVFKPDGTENKEPVWLLEDTNEAGWRIGEIRRSCDEDAQWQEVGGQTCAHFQLYAKTWEDARQYCHNNDGFLIDETYMDKDSYLEENGEHTNFWIGLSDIDNEGQFMWDALDGESRIPFNASAYTNWAPGEPSDDPSDPSKRCVARIYPTNAKAFWYLKRCNESFAFVCEKHKFSQEAQPNDIDDVDLPPGKWYVQVKSEKAPADSAWNYTGCEVEIRLQSHLQIFPGFTLDTHSDYADDEAISGSNQNHFITHVYGGGGDREAVLSYANLYESNTMTMEAAATYQKRRGCTYPWLSQTWHCPNYDDRQNKFAVIHSGEDQKGNNFQRMSTGHCRPPLTACANGGMVYNGTCVCEDLWVGKTCETPKCINGGKLNELSTTCICPKGWAGHACQYDQCLPQVQKSFSIDRKSFVLVVEMTTLFESAVRNLARGIEDIMNNAVKANPKWFSNFILVTVDSKSLLNVSTLASMADFIAAVKELPGLIRDIPTVCGAPLYGALTEALSAPKIQSPGSIVFVATRGVPTDSATNNADFMIALTNTKAQINYLAVDDNEKVCGYYADDDRVKNLGLYALASGGNMFILPSNTFVQFLVSYLPTVYASTLLTTPTLTDMSCTNKQWFAQVDYRMETVFLTVFASTGALSIVDPFGDVHPTQVLYSNGRTKLLTFQTHTVPGVYTIKMNSPVSCMVQVRGDSPLTVYTGFVQPTPGGDNGAHNDDVVADPVAGVSNMVALHLDGVDGTKAKLTYAELINPYDNKIVVSQLYRRQSCSYEYYSKPFNCPEKSFLVMVNGVDDHGQNFRREVAIAYCIQRQEKK